MCWMAFVSFKRNYFFLNMPTGDSLERNWESDDSESKYSINTKKVPN